MFHEAFPYCVTQHTEGRKWRQEQRMIFFSVTNIDQTHYERLAANIPKLSIEWIVSFCEYISELIF